MNLHSEDDVDQISPELRKYAVQFRGKKRKRLLNAFHAMALWQIKSMMIPLRKLQSHEAKKKLVIRSRFDVN